MVRNKVLTFKEAANSMYVDEDISFCHNIDQCVCADSSLCNPHHK